MEKKIICVLNSENYRITESYSSIMELSIPGKDLKCHPALSRNTSCFFLNNLCASKFNNFQIFRGKHEIENGKNLVIFSFSKEE